MHCRAGRQ
jgi:aryl-alcohol dehydrogenase-like predicted oxidoreductase